jgi:SAM-dependent methyltransferase
VVRTDGDITTLNIEHLLQLTRVQYDQIAASFDACLLLTGKSMVETSDELIEHIAPLLKPNGQIIILVANSNSPSDAAEFSGSFAAEAGRLLNRSVWIEDVKYVELTPKRQSTRHALMSLTPQIAGRPTLVPLIGLLTLRNYYSNRRARTVDVPPLGSWSSVCVTLRASGQPSPYPLRFEREAALKRAALQSAPQLAVRAGLPEQQDDSWQDLKQSPIWRDDPAHAATALAGYRFVMGLMGFRHDVAELGCANPLGTRLVLQQFKRIALFDPRQIAVRDLSWRFRDNWRFEARVHDILAGPLPRQVDSAYSIEFIKYFSKDEEDTFVRHMRDSLSRDFDFVVIGSPCYHPGPNEFDSLDAGDGEIFASAQGGAAALSTQAGPVTSSAGRGGLGQPAQNGSLRAFDHALAPIAPRTYRRTGAELKALAERHFRSVFVFSLVGDTVQPGIDPGAKHIFALGCGK